MEARESRILLLLQLNWVKEEIFRLVLVVAVETPGSIRSVTRVETTEKGQAVEDQTETK